MNLDLPHRVICPVVSGRYTDVLMQYYLNHEIIKTLSGLFVVANRPIYHYVHSLLRSLDQY